MKLRNKDYENLILKKRSLNANIFKDFMFFKNTFNYHIVNINYLGYVLLV